MKNVTPLSLLALLREINEQLTPDRFDRNGFCLDTKINGATLGRVRALFDHIAAEEYDSALEVMREANRKRIAKPV